VFGSWSPSTFHLVLFALGGVLVYAGQDWSVPLATEIGTAVLGVFMIAVGIDMIFKRARAVRQAGWLQQAVVDMYRGLAELLWGLLFIVLGLVVLAFALMSRFGSIPPETFLGNLLNTPSGLGAILAFTGTVMLTNGIIRMLGGSWRVDARHRGGLPYWADRSVGAAVLLMGLGIALTGLLVLVAPDTAARGVENLFRLLVGA
jgi:hypothetical protein